MLDTTRGSAGTPGIRNHKVDLARAIDSLNATEGDITLDVARLMNLKRKDDASYLLDEDALEMALTKFSMIDIKKAFLIVGVPMNARGLRWMCRGLRPDRWAVCAIKMAESKKKPDRRRLNMERRLMKRSMQSR